MKIGIRADGNNIIATGHLMRCISIALELRKNKIDFLFLVADEDGQAIVDKYNLPVIILNSKWNDLDKEIEQIKNSIIQYEIDILLVDSYYVTEKYFEELKPLTKLAYIDDLMEHSYACDYLINYSLYADGKYYEQQYKGTKLLLGCCYAPIKEEFQKKGTKKIKENVTDILVLTGGTDLFHFMEGFCEYIYQHDWTLLRSTKFHIVCGVFNQDRYRLEEMAKECRQLRVYPHVENIMELMKKADIAISAGGSTLYELCACGTPTITYILADNQIRNAQEFAKRGIMKYAGDIREQFDFDGLFCEITKLAQSKSKRAEMSENMQKLVDGYGVKRIVKAICEDIIV